MLNQINPEQICDFSVEPNATFLAFVGVLPTNTLFVILNNEIKSNILYPLSDRNQRMKTYNLQDFHTILLLPD